MLLSLVLMCMSLDKAAIHSASDNVREIWEVISFQDKSENVLVGQKYEGNEVKQKSGKHWMRNLIAGNYIANMST